MCGHTSGIRLSENTPVLGPIFSAAPVERVLTERAADAFSQYGEAKGTIKEQETASIRG